MMDPDYNRKLIALEKILENLSELEVSSAFYPDKEAYRKFEKSYYDLVKNICQYQKNAKTEKICHEIDDEFVAKLKIKKEDLEEKS